jgi:hypothetical protein
MPGDRRAVDIGADLAGWQALHARLALVESGAVAPSARLESRRGAIFWVTARPRLPRGLQRTHGERYVVSPGAAPAGAAVTVAGCSGIRLGRAHRRVA